MSSEQDHRYAHIDAMRAAAVMLVVVAHAGLGAVVPGGSGVTIFFSISGFIITYLLLREKDTTGGFKIGAFYLRRFLKIGPPLIVSVIVPTLVLTLFRDIDWPPFLGVIFFYFNWFKASGVVDAPLPGSGVVWSLSIEEQFYVLFALIWLLTVWLGLRMRWLALVAAVAAVASLVLRIVLASSGGNHTDRIYYGSDTRLDGIALGVLTAIAFHYSLTEGGWLKNLIYRGSRDSALIFALSLYLASLLIRNEWFANTFRFTFQSIAACVVIVYGFAAEQSAIRNTFNRLSRVRLLQLIGLASYSIYLVHAIAIFGVMRFIPALPHVVSIPLLIVFSTSCGILLYFAVERPIHRAQLTRRSSRALRQRT